MNTFISDGLGDDAHSTIAVMQRKTRSLHSGLRSCVVESNLSRLPRPRTAYAFNCKMQQHHINNN